MYRTELYKRLSYGYNSGWRQLDTHRYVGNMKVFPRKITSVSGADSAPTVRYSFLVELQDKRLRSKDVERPLRDHFQHSCRCEHDCCGHTFSHTERITRVGRGRYMVSVRESYNV
jgi:hypothetical protein